MKPYFYFFQLLKGTRDPTDGPNFLSPIILINFSVRPKAMFNETGLRLRHQGNPLILHVNRAMTNMAYKENYCLSAVYY